ncbi:ABC transporter substrate-binding protein [Prauserella marina]|uniref:DNA-binding transcriptional regulator, PucR family n=1 Tax=Prauserella marina TaxID=530584 RepID=A0A222VTA0_9PSEU|nr:helix-turn-helix domain-containing protein [Prauserella marina]ASR37156.1 ABC transporter substrate-binding protein [Prauserella marina]PWV72464.1 DNA-binding PucR family transcriptional regulator [Prauserella marina]SDD79473.1 DNA-binding transcriptional regulator, PucR family [Prauserella marina]
MPEGAGLPDSLSRVAGALGDRANELTTDLVTLYEAELPHLINDTESMVSLLAAGIYQNIDTALRAFQHGIEPSRVEAPTAALEYARRLAQRGTPVIDLIRAYYLGQTAVLDQALAEATRQLDDPRMLGEVMRRALATAFAFIDKVTQQVVSAYEDERGRWQHNRSAVRTARVRALLEDAVVDIDASEAALGYRLRGTHLALIAWYVQEERPADPLAGLEALAARLGADWTEPGPLFVPHDELCAWLWLPVTGPAKAVGGERENTVLDAAFVEQVLADCDPEVRLALGEPGRGLSGFRRSHRQAQRVYTLALAAGKGGERALNFRDVGGLALMSADVGAARTWVEDTLGDLAIDDEAHERLRATLRVFLATGGSYTAAAAKLTMHKNSVQYRVRKAEELLTRPVTDNRLDVELALNLCHLLGPAVLARA